MDSGAIITLLITYRYWLLFPIACVEGPLVALVVGILASLGYFNIIGAYAVMLFGDLVPDTAYYFLGRYGKRTSLIQKYGSKIGLHDGHTETVKKIWENHGMKTMWMGKLAYGLSIPFLISAGLAGMPLKRFYLYAIPVTLFQYALLMALGYYFGSYYKLIEKSVFGFESLIAAVALAFGAYYLFTLYMKRRVLREQNNN